MKKSELTFLDGFTQNRKGDSFKIFDWDKAAEIINQYSHHNDLVVEAGLWGDWDYTGGIIFENGKPTSDHYTYLASRWARPMILLQFGNDNDDIELDCYTTEETRFGSDSKWD